MSSLYARRYTNRLSCNPESQRQPSGGESGSQARRGLDPSKWRTSPGRTDFFRAPEATIPFRTPVRYVEYRLLGFQSADRGDARRGVVPNAPRDVRAEFSPSWY